MVAACGACKWTESPSLGTPACRCSFSVPGSAERNKSNTTGSGPAARVIRPGSGIKPVGSDSGGSATRTARPRSPSAPSKLTASVPLAGSRKSNSAVSAGAPMTVIPGTLPSSSCLRGSSRARPPPPDWNRWQDTPATEVDRSKSDNRPLSVNESTACQRGWLMASTPQCIRFERMKRAAQGRKAETPTVAMTATISAMGCPQPSHTSPPRS
jgi:hypothetical protein